MTISVAMTTYNGEKYILEQLKSIYAQTIKPNEVIICDDGSTDNTVSLVRNFIYEYRLEKVWNIVINPINKGYVQNFLDCALMCNGEIIFFCDQDDIWKPKKIEFMLSAFNEVHKIQALTCNYNWINSNGDKLNFFIHKLKIPKGRLNKILFSEHVKDIKCTGMTLAIKREVLIEIYPKIISNKLPFDTPIGGLTAINEGFYNLNKSLVLRRLHANNTSQPKLTVKSRVTNMSNQINGMKTRVYLFNKYMNIAGDLITEKDKSNLQKNIVYLEENIQNLREHRIIKLFFAIFKFNPMINKKYAISNLICALFTKFESEDTLNESSSNL